MLLPLCMFSRFTIRNHIDSHKAIQEKVDAAKGCVACTIAVVMGDPQHQTLRNTPNRGPILSLFDKLSRTFNLVFGVFFERAGVVQTVVSW